jgi:hypothetical protein
MGAAPSVHPLCHRPVHRRRRTLISASGLISDGPIGDLVLAGGLLFVLTVLIHAVALVVEIIRVLGRLTEAR